MTLSFINWSVYTNHGKGAGAHYKELSNANVQSGPREIGMCLCGDTHCHVYTSTEGRKLSSPRHFKMRNGLCRLFFYQTNATMAYLVLVANY